MLTQKIPAHLQLKDSLINYKFLEKGPIRSQFFDNDGLVTVLRFN